MKTNELTRRVLPTKKGHWAKYMVIYPMGTQFAGAHYFFKKREAFSFVTKYAKLATPLEVK